MRFDETLCCFSRSGRGVSETKKSLLQKGVGNSAKGIGLRGRIAVPGGGKGLIHPGLGQTQIAETGKELFAEGGDGFADQTSGAEGEKVAGQKNGQEFFL